MAGPHSVIRHVAFGGHKRLSGTVRKRPRHKGFCTAWTVTNPAVLDCPARLRPGRTFEDLEFSPWSANGEHLVDVFLGKSLRTLLAPTNTNLERVHSGSL